MNIDEAALKAEQAEFEKWADTRKGATVRNSMTGDFDYPLGRLLWEAWQARALLQRSQPVARSRGFNATAILEARDAAWRECRNEVGTQGWTTADAAAYFGFFCHGWDHRAGLDTVVPAEQAEDSAMLDWLEDMHFSLSASKEPCGHGEVALWWQVTDGRKSISGHPLASPREAIRAAIGRNREAGNANQG